jgi:hypothetical protein
MFTFFKKYSGKTSALLFALQLLIVFAVPINAAYAQVGSAGNYPTVQAPVCYTGSFPTGPGGSQEVMTMCYRTLGECNSSRRPQATTPCRDVFATMSGAEKEALRHATGNDTYWEMTKGAVADVALDGTVKIVGMVLEFIAKYVAKFAGFFMRSMGHILDMAIDRTINGETYRNLAAVLIGWTAVRDFSNMLFIFVLLYIAIQTILGLAGSNVKRLLSHVVIAALLINFSLFFTQVVIDAGNILAMGFWDQIKTQQGSGAANSRSSAAAKFLDGFRMQTIFDTNGDIMTETPSGPLETNEMQRAMIYAGGAIVMFIAGYVFLAAAVMMIVRTVWLLILMIGSPFAFLSFALPAKGDFANWWWTNLVSQSFVAPALLFMLYLDSIIISSLDLAALTGGVNAKNALAFLGKADNYAIIYQFVILVILLLASLTVANKVSSGAGKMGGEWAKKIIGRGAVLGFAGAASVGRQTFGRAGAAALQDKDGKETEWAKEQRRLVTRGGMKDATFFDKRTADIANARLALAEKGAKGTWDIRNAPMGGLGVTAALKNKYVGIDPGQGGKKSYETHGGLVVGAALAGTTAVARKVPGLDKVIPQAEIYRGTTKEKELIATAKARYPYDPEAQKAYLEGRGVSLDALRNKDAKTAIDRDTAKKQTREKLDIQDKEQKVLDDKLKSGNLSVAERQEAEIQGKAIAEAVGIEMRKLSANERAELAEKYRGNTSYVNNLSKGDLAAIHRLELEGKYKEPVMQNIVQQIMVNEDPAKQDLQEYLQKEINQDKLFTVDFKSINTERYNEMRKRAEQSVVAEKQSKGSQRFQELFTKQNRTPAEDAELKALTS